jgi:hypothetical protein
MKVLKKDQAKVLATLYNASKPLGTGWLNADMTHVMTEHEALSLLEYTTYFDYVRGRVMKLDFSKDDVDTWLYNRDNGENAAENAVKNIL